MSLSTFKNWRIAFLAFTLSFLVVFAPSVQANEVCSDLFGSRVVGAAGNDGDEGGLSSQQARISTSMVRFLVMAPVSRSR